MVYVEGSTSVSNAALGQLNTLLNDPKAKLDEAATFTKFLKDQKGLSQLVGATSDLRLPDWEELEGPTEVKNFKFASGKADALRYVAKIGAVAESTIPIYLPKTFNNAAGTLFLPSVNDVVDILSRGPEQVRRMVKEVHVNPGRNPADAWWATQPGYSNVANFRSYMTAGADGDRRHLPLDHAAQRRRGADEHRPRERPHGVAEAVGDRHERAPSGSPGATR